MRTSLQISSGTDVGLQIYGDNYDKLMALKKRYDPGNKLKGPLRWM